MGRLLEFGLLTLPPDASQPGGRGKSGVEGWHDRQAGEGQADLDGGLRAQGCGEDGDQQDGDDADVTEAERAHASSLDCRSAPGVQPEADAGLADAAAP